MQRNAPHTEKFMLYGGSLKEERERVYWNETHCIRAPRALMLQDQIEFPKSFLLLHASVRVPLDFNHVSNICHPLSLSLPRLSHSLVRTTCVRCALLIVHLMLISCAGLDLLSLICLTHTDRFQRIRIVSYDSRTFCRDELICVEYHFLKRILILNS